MSISVSVILNHILTVFTAMTSFLIAAATFLSMGITLAFIIFAYLEFRKFTGCNKKK